MCACGSGGASAVVGKWIGESEGVEITFEFKNNGTGTMSALDTTLEMTYIIEGSELAVTHTQDSEVITDIYTYTLTDNTLTLTAENDITVVFTRQ